METSDLISGPPYVRCRFNGGRPEPWGGVIVMFNLNTIAAIIPGGGGAAVGKRKETGAGVDSFVSGAVKEPRYTCGASIDLSSSASSMSMFPVLGSKNT